MANNEATRTNIKSQRRDVHGKLLPAVRDTSTKAIMDALNETLRVIRTRHDDIPNVALVVGASGRKSPTTIALGHFAPNRWDGKDAVHELAISGEVLRQGAEGVLDTLLHELTHAKAQNAKNDKGEPEPIKDTSRQGRYHNAKFKSLAESMGLVMPTVDATIGWSNTHLTDETRKLYKPELALLSKALKTYRIPESAKPAKPKTTIKIACGCRSVTVPIKFNDKGIIICSVCDMPFVSDEDAEDSEADL